MKPEYILDADLLDIIFDNKNKNYGAYPLRKYYHERLYKALGIIFLGAMILSLFGILYKNKARLNIFDGPDPYIVKVFEEPREVPLTPQPPQPPKHSAATAVPSTDLKPVLDVHSSSNIVITKEGEKIPEPAQGEGNVLPGNTPPTDGPPGVGESKFPPSGIVEPVKTIDKNIPQPADIMPTFPGGMEALKKFLKKNLVTPKDLEGVESISVKVQFVVGYDGELKGFRVIEDGGAAFNDEVIRVLKKMPAWIPGKAHGENVSVYYTIPVMFTTE